MFDTSLWEKIAEENFVAREKARKDLLAAVIPKLKNYFSGKKVKSVYIFGSILRQGKFFEFSDIDIAMAGLEEDYLQVLVELEELLDGKIDLIELERCRFHEAVKRQGLRVA